MHACDKAFANTSGRFYCTRDEGHGGPCAAVPVVHYEQVATELTAEAQRLGMYKPTPVPNVLITVVAHDPGAGLLVLSMASEGMLPARRAVHADAETLATCPVGTRFRLVRE